MALSITHPTVATGADDPSKEINAGEWNAAHSIAGLGTGVETALAVNVGSAGAFVTFNGALGTPSSGTLTNATGLPVSTGISGLGTGIATALAVNVGTAGAPVVNGGALGTPSSGTLTNATGLPLSTGVTGDLPFANLVQATAASKLVGRGSASGAGDYEEITIGSGLTMTGTTLSASGGSSTWDTIGAAAGDGSTNNGTNRIVYNTAPTADSRIAWRFSESSAATNGTSTSGVPNQVLLQLDTLASSTQSPLKVLSRGNHVFSVSPTAAQILAANGSTSAPTYGFASATDIGMYYASATRLGFTAGGTSRFQIATTSIDALVRFIPINGSASAPGIVDASSLDSGFFFGSGLTAVSIVGVENSRWSAGAYQVSKGTADAVSYAINARKSRGTVASPTVITTGDDLLTISGYGYVGATGTYVEAARIKFDSTGTIANTTSGVGGIVRIEAAAVGAVGPSEIARFTRATTTGGGWMTMDEADANPGTGDLAADEEVAMYRKADKLVFAYNAGGTMNYLVFTLDGATTTFTNSTSAP